MQPVLITTTVKSKEEANQMAAILVNRKLAACVNIVGPVQSIYAWEGKLVSDEEYKLFIKSFKEKWDILKNTIKENHSYKVPEISLIQISGMQEEYLAWMTDTLNREVNTRDLEST